MTTNRIKREWNNHKLNFINSIPTLIKTVELIKFDLVEFIFNPSL